ncbi:Hypothetical predicted protein, partial [Mytilus galloprovincialis]
VGDSYPKGNCIVSQRCDLVNGSFDLVTTQATKICEEDECCTANDFGIYDCTKNSTCDTEPKPNQSKNQNVLLVIRKQVTQRQSLHGKPDNSVTQNYVSNKAYTEVNTESVPKRISNDLKTSEIVRQETTIANPFSSKDRLTNQYDQEMSTKATTDEITSREFDVFRNTAITTTSRTKLVGITPSNLTKSVTEKKEAESTSKEDNVTVNDTLSPFTPVTSTLQEHSTKYSTSQAKNTTGNFSNITEDQTLEATTTQQSNRALTELITTKTTLVNRKSPVEKNTKGHENATHSFNLPTENQRIETIVATSVNLDENQKNQYETTNDSVRITNYNFTSNTPGETTISSKEKVQLHARSTFKTNNITLSTTTDMSVIDAASKINTTPYSLIIDHTKQRTRSSTLHMFTIPQDVSESVASEWSSFKSWSEWTHCSRSCGGGTRERIRYRNCTKPRPVHGGKNCTGLDKDIIFEDCNTNICTSFCTCSRYGGLHYYTSDGADVHFIRTSKYTMWESTIPTDPCFFEVETKDKKRYGYMHDYSTLLVDFFIGNTSIRILQNDTTLLNGIAIKLPTLLINSSIEITRSGSFITAIHSKCNIRVQFDGDHMINVKVSKNHFAGKLTGLCGNCNGNKQDDYQTKSVTVVSEKEWVDNGGVSKSFKDSISGEQPLINLVGVHDQSKCSLKDKVRAMKADRCWYLMSKSSPFKICKESKKVDFSKMFSSCEFDVCFSDHENAHCPTLQHTAYECSQHGYMVKWRTSKICPLNCTGEFVYNTSVSCTNTCENPRSTQNCQDPPVDGCTCPDKTYLNGGKCVFIDNCGSCDLRIEGISSKLAVGDSYPKGNCIVSQRCDLVNGSFDLVTTQATKICEEDECCTANDFGIYDCTKNSTCDTEPKPNQSKNQNVLLVIRKQVTQRQSLHGKPDSSVKSKESIPNSSSTKVTQNYVSNKAYTEVNTESVPKRISNDLKTSEIVRQETTIANPFSSKDRLTNQYDQEMSTKATTDEITSREFDVFRNTAITTTSRTKLVGITPSNLTKSVTEKKEAESTSNEDNVTVNDTLSPFTPVTSTLQEHSTKYSTSQAKNTTGNFSNITEDQTLEATTTQQSNSFSTQQTFLTSEGALTESITTKTTLVNRKSPVEKNTKGHENATNSFNLPTENQRIETIVATSVNLDENQKYQYETTNDSVRITNYNFTSNTPGETTISSKEKVQLHARSTFKTNNITLSTTTDMSVIDAASKLTQHHILLS